MYDQAFDLFRPPSCATEVGYRAACYQGIFAVYRNLPVEAVAGSTIKELTP